jgi:flagellar hook-associated protein 2
MGTTSALSSLLGSSSSAINLSDILEAALGASSPGIDVNEAVSAAVSAAEAPEQNWETQESTLQSQSSALTQIQSEATNLDNDMQALNSLSGPLSAADVTSSNSSIVTGSAAPGTAAGDDVIVVNNLATTDTWSSTTVANSTTALPTGESFTIATSSGSDTITVGDNGVNSISDLANAINAAGLGVTANVITDASGSRLSIVADSSGSAANFTVTSSDPDSFNLSEAVQGQNAGLTVNGISISSASNTVTGAVPGLTLSLLSASPGTQVTLSVAPDTSQATAAINQFVSDYNTLISALNSQFTYTAGSGQGVLADDPTVRNLQSELLQAIDYTYAPSSGTTTVPNLTALGISVQEDGTLSVNNTELQNALQNNFNDVQSFFQGTSLNGFANSLDQQLTSFTSPSDGAFTVDLQSIGTEISGLQTDITNFQTNVIAPLQTQLQSEYSQAEIALQELPAEIKNIDAELGMDNSSNSSS